MKNKPKENTSFFIGLNDFVYEVPFLISISLGLE